MKYITLKKAEKRKYIKIGETVMGHCWLCGSACLLTKNANGHNRHTPIFADLEVAEQKAGQKGLWE